MPATKALTKSSKNCGGFKVEGHNMTLRSAKRISDKNKQIIMKLLAKKALTKSAKKCGGFKVQEHNMTLRSTKHK